LLDDGFQDPSFYKDLSILTVNAEKGFGNKRCIPAGPLRETLSSGLKRADVLISIGAEPSQNNFKKIYKRDINLPIAIANLEVLNTGTSWKNMKAIAFAGIAHPENFFEALRAQGANIVSCQSLSDHQKLSSTIMKRLIEGARAENAQLVTTEKDYVRLPKQFRNEVITLPVRIKLNGNLSWDKIFTPILRCLEK
jgi:tetraacyldisaccharide 4'-kinase